MAEGSASHGLKAPRPRGAGPGLTPPRPPRGPASLRSRVASARRSASFAEQVPELSTRSGRLLSRGARWACCAPSEVPARTDVWGSLGREQSPVRGNLGFRTRSRGVGLGSGLSEEGEWPRARRAAPLGAVRRAGGTGRVLEGVGASVRAWPLWGGQGQTGFTP